MAAPGSERLVRIPRVEMGAAFVLPEGAHRKKNLPPKVPITPMPRYSIMETPVLKKELDRSVLPFRVPPRRAPPSHM